eukprot:TRINITY_DN2483_c0_g1_i2.p1 TRINITY_DN2483_c0_g1~~TRINITY_DN2483_c0_g1_i2.p1  ORF type:complete len:191 (+),score=34.38 TRINITY_DN2483_c0_g1_i2:48-620(+)
MSFATVVTHHAPKLPLGFGGLSLILVIAGLGTDVWSELDCGLTDVEYGWKEARLTESIEYSDCAEASVVGDCDMLKRGGSAALGLGIVAIFTLLPALALYLKGMLGGSRPAQMIGAGLFVLTNVFLLASFASWTSNGHQAVHDFADDFPSCEAKVSSSTNLMIASFVFMLFSSIISIGFYLRGSSSYADV